MSSKPSEDDTENMAQHAEWEAENQRRRSTDWASGSVPIGMASAIGVHSPGHTTTSTGAEPLAPSSEPSHERLREAKRIAAAAFTAGWLQCDGERIGGRDYDGNARVAAEARYLTALEAD